MPGKSGPTAGAARRVSVSGALGPLRDRGPELKAWVGLGASGSDRSSRAAGPGGLWGGFRDRRPVQTPHQTVPDGRRDPTVGAPNRCRLVVPGRETRFGAPPKGKRSSIKQKARGPRGPRAQSGSGRSPRALSHLHNIGRLAFAGRVLPDATLRGKRSSRSHSGTVPSLSGPGSIE